MKISIINNCDITHNCVRHKYTSRPEPSFKAFAHRDADNPYNKGYEDIRLSDDGLILNESKYLIINSKKDFLAITQTKDSLKKYYILNSDIDFEGESIQPVGTDRKPFTGIFNGNGYTLKNIKIENVKNDSGLFAATNNAKIVNLKLENINIEGINDIGGLIGHARQTDVRNCDIKGNVKGTYSTGGVIGIADMCRVSEVKFSGEIYGTRYSGGIIGMDSGSGLTAVYSDAAIASSQDTGGLVGITNKYATTKISDSYFEGELNTNEQAAGAIVGNSLNTEISRCYTTGRPFVGTDINTTLINCFNGIKELNNSINIDNWQNRYWNIHLKSSTNIPANSEYRDSFNINELVSRSSLQEFYKLRPRLSEILKEQNAVTVFLEDINSVREMGLMPNGSLSYTPPEYVEFEMQIKKPEHYAENEKIIDEIKQSKDSMWLYSMFAKYCDKGWGKYNCLVTPENDEIILAIVQNPYLPVNKIYTDSYLAGESICCTPLYVSSRIQKPYIFREMLKRGDVDPHKLCGVNYTSDIFNTLFRYPDDASAYVLYTSANPVIQKYVAENVEKTKKYGQYSPSRLVNIMNKMYPLKPSLDTDKNMLKVPREMVPEFNRLTPGKYDSNNNYMLTLDDVLRNMDANLNFRDSNGNNMVNAAITIDNELEALTAFRKAGAAGVSLRNKNDAGQQPIDYLLDTGKNPSVLSSLIDNINEYYRTNSYGENAIHIFSKLSDENKAIIYIKKAIDRGMSINFQDKSGATALRNAIENKNVNLMNFLIKNGANVNLIDKNGQTDLHTACINCDSPEDLEIIYTLLNRNANPNIRDNNGLLPFDYLDDEYKAFVNFTSDKIDEIKSKLETQPVYPIRQLQYDAHAEFIKDNNIGSNYTTGITTSDTVDYNQPITVSSFISKTASAKDNKELTVLCSRLLRDLPGYDIREARGENGNNLVHILAGIPLPIANECLIRVLKIAPEAANGQNSFGETPLIKAIGDYDMTDNDFEKLCIIDNITSILGSGTDVNIMDNNRQNAMHRVCQTDSLFLLSKLLDMNININQKDSLGKNPLEYLPKDIGNKMRNYYENYARSKSITLGIENIVRRI